MRFSVPQLSHTFLRMVLFVVAASALLTPLATVFAQSDINGNGFIDSWETNVPAGGGITRNPYDLDSTPTVTTGAGGVGYDVNGNGTIDAGEPITNPAGFTGEQIIAANQYTSQMRLDDNHGLLVTIGGWVAGFGGNVFELAYTNFALKMGCYFVESGAGCDNDALLVENGQVGAVVNVLWQVIRDLVNIAIIFSLVYIGFMLIVNGDDSGTKKALGGIIMAALLVNFSLYIAKVVVDVSNFSTTAIYRAMDIAGGGGFGVVGEDADGDGQSDTDGDVAFDSTRNGSTLASHFMTVLRITTMYDVDQVNSPLAFAILSMFFLIFLGAIFAYGAIMMLARFLAIIVLLIFSPVMFLGLVLPNFKGISNNWRQKFIGYCLFAPAFTFMIYISLYTLIQMAPSTGSYGAAFNGDGASAAGSMPIFLFFFVGAGLLFMSTKVAGTIASGSGTFLTKTADGWAKKISYGAAGLVATVPNSALGKGMTATADAMERRTGRSNMLSRGLNYSGTKIKNQKMGGVNTAQSIAGAKKWWKESGEAGDKRARGLRDDAAKEAKIKSALATLNNSSATTSQIEHAMIDLKGDSVVTAIKEKGGVETLKKHAEYLRPDQIKALEDAKDLDKADVKAVLKSRTDKIKTTVAVKDANDDQLTAFGFDDLNTEANAIALTEAKIDKLAHLTASEKQAVKNKRKAALVTVAGGTSIGTMTQDTLINSKPEDLAKLPSDAFKIQSFAEKLPANAIKSRHFADLDPGTQKEIRKHLETRITWANNPSNGASAAEVARLTDIYNWLNSPAGNSFGK